MRDLSLHLLNLIENSIHAGATVVSVSVEEDAGADRLVLTVDDNGPGIPERELDRVCDPFYTTKGTARKRTGLGLSFLKEAAEAAGGTARLARSPLGGLSVRAEMRMSHVDRPPMGDIAATLSSAVCLNPHLDFRFARRSQGRERGVSSETVAKRCADGIRGGLAVARMFGEAVRNCLAGSSG